MWPKHVIMVTPQHFDISYAINPHMMTQDGQLKSVDKTLAQAQWMQLKKTFQNLGLEVSVFDGVPQLPDMVFCANPLFPFTKNNRTHYIASNMHSAFRTKESSHFARWVNQNNREVFHLPETIKFEGMGDALWNYSTQEIYGGHGFRTSPEAYNHIEAITGQSVIKLQLINENFYHLDTALAIIDGSTAVIVPEAFSDESLDKLKMKFKTLIYADPTEAQSYLAANACSVDGKNVIIEKNAVQLKKDLQYYGYKTHDVSTSEYLKSGGSIFCMKLLTWEPLYQNLDVTMKTHINLDEPYRPQTF